MFILHATTIICGLIGMSAGIAMIGIKSILDIWWELSGIFAGGMLGLFLLGLISKHTKSKQAFIAVIVGVIVIVWMSFSSLIPAEYAVAVLERDSPRCLDLGYTEPKQRSKPRFTTARATALLNSD